MCGAGRQPRSSPHIGDHGQLHSTSSRSKYRCALALKPTPSMRYRRPRTDMAAAWHACACSSAGEVAAAAAADTATIIAAVAIAAVAAAVTVAAVAAATAASACGKVQLCRAQAARAARRGGARAGSSGGARERFTRRCARGSACARRVTCAAARRFAAGRGPWLVLTLSAFARPHAQVRERHLRPRPRCHRAASRAASQVVGAAPPVRPPTGGATGGEFGALPLDPQVRATPPQAVGATRPVAHVRLFSRSPLRALVRAAVAGRRLSAANAAVGAASVNVPPYAVRARRRHLPPHPPHGMSVLERGCVAARARRRRSARYALLAARRAHASAALCSGSDRRCPLRRRVPQRGARAPPPLHPPLLVCAGVWFRCLARTFVRCLARCVVLATPRTHACAPCAQAPTAGGVRRRASHGATTPQRGHPTRERCAVVRNHACNYAMRVRGSEASATAHTAFA